MGGGSQPQHLSSLYELQWDHGWSEYGLLLLCVPSARSCVDVRYVFFEKKRIYEGEEKSDLRVRQEAAFPQGRDMERLRRTHVWVGPGATVRWDSLGRMVITTDGVARKFS